MIIRNRWVFAATGIALLMCARVRADAEDGSAGAAGPTAAGGAVAAPAAVAPGSADEAGIDTVTVTAQRRTQVAQDVPIPVAVVTPQLIDSLAATDLATMSGYVPGLQVDGSQPTQPGYTLRGISVSDFGIGTDSPIGIYEDGVYTGKTGGALLLFDDVQRIEVLKGPQGTLFGRNSAAGAISVVSNEPTDYWGGAAHGRPGCTRQLRRQPQRRLAAGQRHRRALRPQRRLGHAGAAALERAG
jgi:iron complex outermembrane recepter protein